MFSGYTAEDILSVIMRVTKTYPMTEFMQLEFIRVRKENQRRFSFHFKSMKIRRFVFFRKSV